VTFWLVIAAVKTLVGAAASIALVAAPGPSVPGALSPLFNTLLMAVFVCSGFALIAGARGDGPPRALGAVFVVFGSIFADTLIVLVAPRVPELSLALRLLHAIQPVALSPAFFWRFAWEFPRTQPGLVPPRAARAIRETTYYAGVAMFVALAAHGVATATLAPPSKWSGTALRDALWLTLVILEMPTLVLLVAKLQTALPDERRRLRLFIGGLVLGSAPLLLDILAGAFVPSFRAYTKDPAHRLVVAQIIALAILLLPAVTAYAVVVERLLETRFIVRMAIQYALARYTVFAVMAVPAAALVLYLYTQRQRPLAEILGSASPGAWVSLVAVALLGWLRAPILRAIDRRFFREQHDARDILVSLTDSTRRATSLEQMATLVRGEIDRAFHVEHVAVLVKRHAAFIDPTYALAPLGAATALATLVGGAATPLDVGTSDPGSPLSRLPADEREWLGNVHARLIVPLLGGGGALIGFLTLGERRSEAPYSGEDRALLRVVAAAAATALEQQLRHSAPGADTATHALESARATAEDPAQQCGRCELVLEPSVDTCPVCGGRLTEAAVPKLLCGKFAVERRIGSGGMGIVYLALDTSLDRLVAVKTLHRLSPTEARRLRREARALATLQHEHLEMIYAVESWRGSPILVLEYLAGGTLAFRVRGGPLGVIEAAELGVTMAEALHSLHRVGVLHCDIKPSNIGFTAKRIPKLLDFGLATAAAARQAPMSSRPVPQMGTTTHTDSFAAHAFLETRGTGPAGTLLYMSPEAIDGAAPDVTFDLWSLAVTLYEAMAGFNPFVARDRLDTIHLIKAGNPPDLSATRQDCPRSLATVIAHALSPDIRQRPATAREFAARLRHAVAEARATQTSGLETR
jgi:hypothetical protein